MKSKADHLLKQGDSFEFYENSKGGFGRLSDEYQAWLAIVEDFIITTFGRDSSPFRLYSKFDPEQINGYKRDDFERQHAIVIAALKACKKIEPITLKDSSSIEAMLDNLFNKFHSFVIQLRIRHASRATLDVHDEYDVQDLLHCLLKLHFNDIRKEEWTPQYAGGSARMDFFLKEEQTVIEVKKTRAGLGDRELGNQLIEDKARYKAHQGCKKLICFTYDPDGRITNPRGLQNDLNQNDKEFKVVIVIKPSN